MPQLIDQWGQPLERAAVAQLREEVAAPTLGGVRPSWSGHPAEGMTPWRLAEIHRAAAMGYSLAYQELAEDIEERDLHYAAVLGTRKRSVTQLPMNITPASKDAEHVKHCAFIQDWLEGGALDDVLFDLLDGIGKGYSVAEIEWEVTPKAILPRAFAWRPQRFFEIDRVDGNSITMRDNDGFLPLLPQKFVVHRHPAKTGLLLRAGIARIASWAWMFKSFTLRDWAQFAQNFGMPIRLGRYGPDASPADRNVLWRAVTNLAGDCAATIPKSMDIEFIEAGNLSGSAEMHERRANWFDSQVSKLILGQTATTDAAPGSHAAGRTHRLVQEDIERSDAKMLATTIKRQVVAPIIAFNFGAQDSYPNVRIGHTDDVPLMDLTRMVQWLGPQGLVVKSTDIRERLGLEEPQAGDETIGGMPPPPAPTVAPPKVTRTAEPNMEPGTGEPGEEPSAAVAHALLPGLRLRHPATVRPDLLDQLIKRVELDGQGALAGLTDQVRAAFDEAVDLPDLARRLSELKLDAAGFADAMARGMAVARLVGQSALLDEIAGGG